MPTLDKLLQTCAALHQHLCPRQVLGVRMGLLAGQMLGLDLPQADKRLLAIVETDGCAADGIAVAANCHVGRRTMRIEDYGKVAATFIDTHTGQALRIAPHAACRQRARAFAPQARNKWQAQLLGYQHMPAADLVIVQNVQLETPVEQIISRRKARARCETCGEEIINERELVRDGVVLCQSCAGQGYSRVVDSE